MPLEVGLSRSSLFDTDVKVMFARLRRDALCSSPDDVAPITEVTVSNDNDLMMSWRVIALLMPRTSFPTSCRTAFYPPDWVTEYSSTTSEASIIGSKRVSINDMFIELSRVICIRPGLLTRYKSRYI